MTEKRPFRLSIEGRCRRQSILEDALNELNARSKRRRQRRLAATSVLTLTLVISVGWWMRFHRPLWKAPQRPESQVIHQGLENPSRPAENGSRVAIVHLRSDVNERHLVSTSDLGSIKFQPVKDGELLALLSDAGQPSALARIDGRLTVLPTYWNRRRE